MASHVKSKECDDIAMIISRPRLWWSAFSSIALTVYSRDEVKRGIFLMLLRVVQKETTEGIMLHVDINT